MKWVNSAKSENVHWQFVPPRSPRMRRDEVEKSISVEKILQSLVYQNIRKRKKGQAVELFRRFPSPGSLVGDLFDGRAS